MLYMDDWSRAVVKHVLPGCGRATNLAVAHVTVGGGHAVTLNNVRQELPPGTDTLYA